MSEYNNELFNLSLKLENMIVNELESYFKVNFINKYYDKNLNTFDNFLNYDNGFLNTILKFFLYSPQIEFIKMNFVFTDSITKPYEFRFQVEEKDDENLQNKTIKKIKEFITNKFKISKDKKYKIYECDIAERFKYYMHTNKLAVNGNLLAFNIERLIIESIQKQYKAKLIEYTNKYFKNFNNCNNPNNMIIYNMDWVTKEIENEEYINRLTYETMDQNNNLIKIQFYNLLYDVNVPRITYTLNRTEK